MQTHQVDAFCMVLFTWPLVAAMLLLPRWYVTRRTQLVMLVRLCVMCLPPLFNLTSTFEQVRINLLVRGSWIDTPGSTLATTAANLRLAEYQLKQLLALAAVSVTQHLLLVSW
jgi:hypothetical protein